MKSKSSTFILIVVILLIVGGLVYFFVIKGDSSTATPATGLVSTNTGKSTGIAVATTGGGTGDQVVSLLRNLSVIQLSDAIFQNPSFSMLQDISIGLPPVTNQGRRNPFAVVGGDNAAFPVTSGTTSLIGIPAVITPNTGSSASGTSLIP